MADRKHVDAVHAWFRNAHAILTEHEAALGRLDAAAGDGDHGAGMVRGMRAAHAAVSAALQNRDDGLAPGPLLMQGGSAFADAAGGASGALYGMLMMTIGQKLGADIDMPTLQTALRAGMDAIGKLGKSQPGDKTMLDALAPFVDVFGQANAASSILSAWRDALPAAQAGADSTAHMIAKKGRSARLAERSLEHRDPGAVSMVLLLQAVEQTLVEVHCGQSDKTKTW